MDANHKGLSAPCLTGGVEAALTTKEADFLEDPNGDWNGRLPRICLADSIDEVREEDETRAWVAILLFLDQCVICRERVFGDQRVKE